METPAFLVDQLAAERSVSTSMARSGVMRLCRSFMIDLSDYRPYAKKRDAGEQIKPASRNIHQPATALPIFTGLSA